MNRTTKVSIAHCEDYDRGRVAAAVKMSFEYFGGINNFIHKGDKVLLKPNLLKASALEECVITHTVVIEAVAQKVLEAGAIPIIGDSPAFGAVRKITQRAGLDKFAEKHGIAIIELDIPQKIRSKCGDKPFSLAVSGKALDVDAIINIPKLKAHGQMLYTAAVKNMYGCVSGKAKAWRHVKSNNNIKWYSEMLLANYNAVKPVFTIVDAIMAMERVGPTKGDPKKLSMLICGVDGISIDRVIAEIINVHPSQSPLLRTAAEHNIGEQDLNNIEIAGTSLSEAKTPDFKLPKLIPIGFGAIQMIKSVVRHIWLKKFGKAA